MLSAVVGKLRPASKASEDTHTESMHEKADQQGNSPDSPHSVSSEPTAVPSPESQSQALDEKEAIRSAEGPAADRAAAKQVYGIVDNNSNENRQVSVEGSDEKAAIKQSDSNGDEKSATKQAEEDKITRQRTIQYSDSVKDANVNEAPETTATQSAAGVQRSTSKKGRRRGNTKSSTKPPMEEVLTREEAEELLKLVQGHLVQWPYDWYVLRPTILSRYFFRFPHADISFAGSRKKNVVGIGCIISISWLLWRSMTDGAVAFRDPWSFEKRFSFFLSFFPFPFSGLTVV